MVQEHRVEAAREVMERLRAGDRFTDEVWLRRKDGSPFPALAFLEDNTADLVLTDVIMPKTSGPELIQELRGRDPQMRSLFMSGYVADELEARGLDRDTEHFLPKPFTPHDLMEAVRTALRD